ncbi:unnamed protein product [Acanthoscelides obtectus]|uniref:PiggyBac transposable element-derived protein domain-containing protein n=1 Tax=Acanthoscelides obtectus TaxID=200917 RepID=A0A9P0PNQ9_ACAOB|nr:unnamed protein product [Acanthoscelides obtectus]CAK1688426.1 PiggyBac transposable element-derived protein 3 [Acanthoscelides obtectus]
MYWENNSDAGNKLVYSALSRDRLRFIMQNLHLNDNNKLENTDKGLKCTGTLRENRLSDCPLEKSSMFKKKSRGSFDYLLEENQNNITQQVKRFSQKEKKMIHVEQPRLIKQYNENMGGVATNKQHPDARSVMLHFIQKCVLPY